MKTIPVILAFLFFGFSRPMGAQEHFAQVDSFAKAFRSRYADAADLSRQLTAPFKTDRDKARVLFAWIAFNVKYDYKEAQNPHPAQRVWGDSPQDVKKKMQEIKEAEIANTLRSKKGICGDYSNLFQKMAEVAGLNSVFIGGISRRTSGGGGSHAWNAVEYDGKWHLLDATWGAGFVDGDSEHFVREYAPAFFDTPPELFILNHLPDDAKWQLLENPLSTAEFNRQPQIDFSNPDYPITAFLPKNGQIQTREGKAVIELKFEKVPQVLIVATGKDRELQATVTTTKEGWTVIAFSPGNASSISLYAGKSRKMTERLLHFKVVD